MKQKIEITNKFLLLLAFWVGRLGTRWR